MLKRLRVPVKSNFHVIDYLEPLQPTGGEYNTLCKKFINKYQFVISDSRRLCIQVVERVAITVLYRYFRYSINLLSHKTQHLFQMSVVIVNVFAQSETLRNILHNYRLVNRARNVRRVEIINGPRKYACGRFEIFGLAIFINRIK